MRFLDVVENRVQSYYRKSNSKLSTQLDTQSDAILLAFIIRKHRYDLVGG